MPQKRRTPYRAARKRLIGGDLFGLASGIMTQPGGHMTTGSRRLFPTGPLASEPGTLRRSAQQRVPWQPSLFAPQGGQARLRAITDKAARDIAALRKSRANTVLDDIARYGHPLYGVEPRMFHGPSRAFAAKSQLPPEIQSLLSQGATDEERRAAGSLLLRQMAGQFAGRQRAAQALAEAGDYGGAAEAYPGPLVGGLLPADVPRPRSSYHALLDTLGIGESYTSPQARAQRYAAYRGRRRATKESRQLALRAKRMGMKPAALALQEAILGGEEMSPELQTLAFKELAPYGQRLTADVERAKAFGAAIAGLGGGEKEVTTDLIDAIARAFGLAPSAAPEEERQLARMTRLEPEAFGPEYAEAVGGAVEDIVGPTISQYAGGGLGAGIYDYLGPNEPAVGAQTGLSESALLDLEQRIVATGDAKALRQLQRAAKAGDEGAIRTLRRVEYHLGRSL